MTEFTPATHGSFAIDRRFDAKPARVFAAFSDIEAKGRWFAGPAGWIQTERSLDFRVGGIEIAAGQWPDGKRTRFTARFEEIVPDRRIVYSYHMHIDDWHISVSLATIELVPDGNGTKIAFTEHCTFLNGYDDPCAAGRKEGSEGLLTNLEAFVTG